MTERTVSFTYHFEVDRSGEIVTIQVCKQAFLHILGIKKGRLEKKVLGCREDHKDHRGSHANRPNKIPEVALEKVSIGK